MYLSHNITQTQTRINMHNLRENMPRKKNSKNVCIIQGKTVAIGYWRTVYRDRFSVIPEYENILLVNFCARVSLKQPFI